MSTKFSGTPEGEMIKILTSIENSLKSTAMTKREVTPAKGSAAAAARAIQAEVKSAISPIIRPINQVADANKSLRDTTIKLNRHLEVSRTRFTSLNDEMGKFLKKLKNNTFSSSDFDKSIFTAADGVGEALIDARKNVIKLNKSIDISASKFDVLNGSIAQFLESINITRMNASGDEGISRPFSTDDVVQAIVDTKHVIQSGIKGYIEQSKTNTTSIIEAINKLGVSAGQLAQRPTVLDTQPLNPVLQQTAEILSDMASTQPVQSAPTSPTVNPAPDTKQSAEVTAEVPKSGTGDTLANSSATRDSTVATGENAKAIRGQTSGFKNLQNMLGKYIMTQARQIQSMDRASIIVDAFAKSITAATQQFFALAAMGMGSVGNMYDLNVAALKAGMSVREYTEMMVKNMEFAARAGSIDNFDAITSSNNAYLKELGVFGESAKRLQVNLAQVATEMGVSQKDIPAVSYQMIQVFDRLNKTVSMTSNEFQEAMTTIADSNAFRSEAAGLDAQERQARLLELTETYTLGRQMGLSAEEANKLGKALLDQRKLTVKDRIKESANLVRLASLTGNAQLIPELQSLSMKRIKNSEETKRYADLLGKLERDTQQGLEYSSQTNNLGLENALQESRAALSGNVDTIMQGTAKAGVADESREKGNDAFGKHVGQFGQIVGSLGTILQGAQKSEVLSPLLTGLAAGLSLIFGKQITGMLVELAKSVRRGKLPAGPGGGTPDVGGGGPKTGSTSKLKSFTETLSKAVDATVQKFAQLKNGLTDIGPKMRGIVSSTTTFVKDLTISATDAIKNSGPIKAAAKMLPASLSGLFSGIGSSAKFGSSAIMTAMKVAGGALKSIPVIGQLISVGVELFTGDLRDAFSPNGGFINGIASALLAIPYSLADLVVSGMEFIFGENLLKPVRTVLDSVGAGIMAGVNTMVAWVAKTISWFTDLLPADSALRKTVNSWNQNAAKVADDSQRTLARTMNGETLSAISKENKDKRAASNSEPVSAQETPTKRRRISSDPNSETANEREGSKGAVPDDRTVNVLNAILNVLTEIRDNSKMQSFDPFQLGQNNPVSQSSKIGDLGATQQRLLSNM